MLTIPGKYLTRTGKSPLLLHRPLSWSPTADTRPHYVLTAFCLSVPVPTSSVFRNTVTQGSSMHHRRSSPLQDSFGRCSLLEGGKSGPTALRPQGRVLALAPGHGAKEEEGLWLVKSDSSSTPRFLTLVTGTLPVLGFNHGENTHLRQHHGVNSDSLLHPTLMKNTGHTIKRATQIHPQQLSSQPTTLATVPTVTTPRFHSWCCNGQASP